MRRTLFIGIICSVIALAFIWNADSQVKSTSGYINLFQNPKPGLESALAIGDGQAYAALARDPTMARANQMGLSPSTIAYRYQRPLFSYVSWALSLGQKNWEPFAQAVAAALGVGATVAAAAEFLRRRRINKMFSFFVLLTPGLLSLAIDLTAETVGVALLLWGLLFWYSSPRATAPAIILLTAAALTRESFLIAVVTMILIELARKTNRRDHARNALPLLIPFVGYAAWLGVLYIRIGALPFSNSAGLLTLVPFSGAIHSFNARNYQAGFLVFLLGTIAFVLVSIRIIATKMTTERPLAYIVISYAIFALFIGPRAWGVWENATRSLIPIQVIGMILLIEYTHAVLKSKENELSPT